MDEYLYSESSIDSAFNVKYYKFWVPLNASSIEVNVNNTSPNCPILQTIIRTDGLPCSYYYSTPEYHCYSGHSFLSGIDQINLGYFTPSSQSEDTCIYSFF